MKYPHPESACLVPSRPETFQLSTGARAVHSVPITQYLHAQTFGGATEQERGSTLPEPPHWEARMETRGSSSLSISACKGEEGALCSGLKVKLS